MLLPRGGETDPVHADTVTFILMAEGLVEELERPATAYTNRGTKTNEQMRKKPLHHNPAPGMTLRADADKVTGEEIVEAEAIAHATMQPRVWPCKSGPWWEARVRYPDLKEASLLLLKDLKNKLSTSKMQHCNSLIL